MFKRKEELQTVLYCIEFIICEDDVLGMFSENVFYKAWLPC